jgi:predicted ATP-grasp superfamily ATP-dependent carboligase
VAIVGASVRAAAQSALRAGFDVVAADMFADEDLRRLCPATRIADYPEGLVAWLRSVDADAWFYTGALENHPDLIDELARIKPLWGNAGRAIQSVRDHAQLCKALTRAGLGFPKTCSSAAGLPLDGSWLCKTHRGSSGSGVWVLDGAAALDRTGSEGAEFQRRLDLGSGKPASVIYFFGEGDARTLGVTQQIIGCPLTGAAPFQYAGSLGPLRVASHVAEQLDALRDLLVETFQLCGVVGVDLWIDDERAWVLEVNPRYTASVELLERATGVPAFGLIKDCVETDSTVGKLILFAKREVTVSASFSNWALAQSAQEPWPALADIPAAGEAIPSGAPVLTLFAKGLELDVESLFAERVAQVERRLYS